MKPVSTNYIMKVPFYDIDPMNVVWHGNYVKYLEDARCDFFKKIKYTYKDMYTNDIAYPVAKIELKYIKSAHFGEDLRIKCILDEIEPALVFKYEIFDNDTNEKICSAKTMQMRVNSKTKETILTAPDELKTRLENYAE